MNFQWTWIFGIVFAIIIAVFSVLNVDSVPVNYAFGTAEWPLVLVILSSALLGAAVSGFVALFKAYKGKHKLKEMQKEIAAQESLIAAQQTELKMLRKGQTVEQSIEGTPPFENASTTLEAPLEVEQSQNELPNDSKNNFS